jgi:hypothetical protein
MEKVNGGSPRMWTNWRNWEANMYVVTVTTEPCESLQTSKGIVVETVGKALSMALYAVTGHNGEPRMVGSGISTGI